MEKNENQSCKCVCHKMNGIFVVLLGVLFLLGALDIVTQKVVSTGWPILVILLGLKNSFGKGKCKCCAKA